MTFVTNKRTIGGILLVLAAIFVYLGYSEGHQGVKEQRASMLPGEEAYLVDSVTVSPEESSQINVEQSSVPKLDDRLDDLTGEEFFVEYRLERDRTRSRQIELLQSIVDNPNSAQTQRQEAQKKILTITTTLEQEIKLENLIKAKGYQEAVLFIQPTSVIVIVQASNFGPNDATKIADLVSKTTGHDMEQITVIPKV
ncbi:SpoIIIAH-like family protein [Zhaonella formicivorans]|uniref:SpoIIIAH-like family protein n=1 Tax=Zhaonella formicivorans TaxID=2528593 RepID=UPI0010E63D19|nr:SpoIIIAH-like family protein [Zhaonella formicivorans]